MPKLPISLSSRFLSCMVLQPKSITLNNLISNQLGQHFMKCPGIVDSKNPQQNP